MVVEVCRPWPNGGGYCLWEPVAAPAYVPSKVNPAGVTFTNIGAGGQVSCGSDTRGDVYCWGNTDDSYLSGNWWSWVPRNMGRANPVRIAVGEIHGCGVSGENRLYCWGRHLGGGWFDGTLLITERFEPDTQVSQVAVGWNYTCFTTTDNRAFCWTLMLDTFARQVEEGLGFTTIASGTGTICATTPINAYCWGANDTRQVGDGTAVKRDLPVPVAGSR
jgi:hypothetical protein